MTEKYVRLSLQKRHINVKGDWLRAAIEWTNSKQPGLRESQLVDKILKQVLFSDLADSYEPPVRLPNTAKRFILPKQHLLQILMVYDVTRPLYEQYKKLVNKKEDDLSWFTCEESNEVSSEREDSKEKTSRMLRIELSDGVVHLSAIVYGGDILINEKTLPGTKLLTKGGVRCRNGVLILNRDNCVILGGECDRLHQNRILFLEAKLGIKDSAYKPANTHVTKDGNMTISPFLQLKRGFENGAASSKLNSMEKTKDASVNPPSKIVKKEKDAMQSVDEQSQDDTNHSLDTIQCTPVIPTKFSNTQKLDESRLFRVPMLPSAANNSLRKTHPAPHELNNNSLSATLAKTEHKKQQQMATSKAHENSTKEVSTSKSICEERAPIKNVVKRGDEENLPDQSVVSGTRVKKDPQASIVPLHALNEVSDNSLNKSSGSRSLLNLSKEVVIAASKNTANRRSLKELEKAAVGTRSITEFVSVLGERPNLKQHCLASAGDMVVPKVEPIEETNTKSASKAASKIRRSLFTALSKSTENVKNAEQPPAENDLRLPSADADFQTPIARVKTVEPSLPPPITTKELLFRPDGVVGNNMVQTQEKSLHLQVLTHEKTTSNTKDSCVGTTPMLSKQFPVVHRRHVEKRDIGTSPLPAQRLDPNDKQFSTSNLKGHQGMQQLVLQSTRAPPNIAVEELRQRKRQLETPSLNGPPPSVQEVPTHERKVTKVQLVSSEKPLPLLNRSLVSLSAVGRNPSLAPNRRNTINPGSAAANTKSHTNPPMAQPSDGLNRNVGSQIYQPLNQMHPHRQPFEFAAALQYRAMEIYEQRFLLNDLLCQRRFWMLSKQVMVVPLCTRLVHELRGDGDRWCLKLFLTDESAANILCVVSPGLLDKLLGFDVSYCKMLYENKSANEAEVARCRRRAVDVKEAFIRLDICFTLEVSRNVNTSPIVVGITQLCEATVSARNPIFSHQYTTGFE